MKVVQDFLGRGGPAQEVGQSSDKLLVQCTLFQENLPIVSISMRGLLLFLMDTLSPINKIVTTGINRNSWT